MKYLLLALLLLPSLASAAIVECDTYKDCRYQGKPVRNADNSIHRDRKVTYAFRKLHPCPSTGLYTGACPDYAINHVCPLACGCIDAVWNMMWLDLRLKRSLPYAADKTERHVWASDPPMPDTAACVNQVLPQVIPTPQVTP